MFFGICFFDSKFFPKRHGDGGDKGKDEDNEQKIGKINFNLLAGVALNRLHITPKEFFDLTPIEYYYALEDNFEIEKQKQETQTKAIFESMRMQTFIQMRMNPYVKNNIKSPEQLIPFAWDEQKSTKKEQSIEEMKTILKSIARSWK